MKYFIYLCLLALQFTCGCLLAQNIGISTSGALPDSSALFDMSSTDKGFLSPRMTTTQMNAITRPATGLTIYNTTVGTYQVNTGTPTAPTWVTLITSAKTRSNYVLVKSATDFPAPVGGIITLVAGTVYEINGTITLTDKINLNNCTIFGADRTNDKLIYTPTSGELFTGANGGLLQNMTISATGVGSKLFNIDAGNNAVISLLLEDIYILNCDNIGLLKGIGGTVAFQSVAFSNNNNGITYQNLNRLVLINSFWIQDNKNTYETFIGTFDAIQILGGERYGLAYYTTTILDISGITSITAGSIKNGFFKGDGIRLTGTFSNQWEIETIGLTTEKDDVAKGSMYISTPAVTALSTVSVSQKVSGTTTSNSLFRFTMPANNRLTYTGTKAKIFSVSLSFSYTAEASNKTFSVAIYKNGAEVAGSAMNFFHGSSTEIENTGITCMVSLSSNDYIEVWVKNITDNKDITLQQMNLTIK